MVSANLPHHTPVTELASLTRTADYLIRRGTDATQSDREACEARKSDREACGVRKKAVMSKLSQDP
ncbi:hypothetical protein JOF56_009971 [Kibdelosporangium banguiense]|uniref:Uncharacterized protein n=1 Tax=Kibdelosporangium banguiense TaxID=1365924 RepID=A0ABS4TYY1_9PSEU|nr:hypothetical protein [Kibdelosporangium banguiense]MBP2329586.1 hypothetical protein [Kibdelosporangium banguiense]